MKRILVPVDFSPFSEKALEASRIIAERAGASVFLIYVAPAEWDFSAPGIPVKNSSRKQVQDTDSKLQIIMDSEAFKNIPVEKCILYGNPYEQIVNFASQQESDLIVIGAYGKEYKNKYYIGSTIQKVLRVAPCPVLVVKNPIQDTQFKTLILAIKPDVEATRVLKKVTEIAHLFASTIHLLLINTPARFISLAQAQKVLDSFQENIPDVQIQTHVYHFSTVEDGLISFTQNMGDCCLALATHERKLSNLYLTGVTETMIYRQSNPVLSVKYE